MNQRKITFFNIRRYVIRAGAILFLSAFLLHLIKTPLPVSAASVEELESRLNALRKKDEELQAGSKNFQSLIDQKKEDIKTIKDEIDNISYQINGLETEIQLTKNRIELTGLEIEKLTLETQKILDEIVLTKDKTAKTIAKLYQGEDISNLELLLSGESFSDFWDQQQYFSNFQSSFNTLLTQMKILREDLSNKKQEGEKNKAQLEVLQTQKVVQQNALDDKRGYQKVLLAQNESQKKQYQIKLSENEKSRRTIIEEILRTEEEVKRLRNFELYVKSGKTPPPGTKIFAWPTVSHTITQGYGATPFARSGVAGYSFHNGIDIGGSIGTPVIAPAPGKVIGKNTTACPNYGRLRSFGCQGGWGNWIALQHFDGLVTLYGHLAQPSTLALATTVSTGDLLGYIGSSGNVTGPHLHFSVYAEFFLVPKGYPGYNPEGTLNPLLYL